MNTDDEECGNIKMKEKDRPRKRHELFDQHVSIIQRWF